MFVPYDAAKAACGLVGVDHVRNPSKASTASKSISSGRSGGSHHSSHSYHSNPSGHSDRSHRTARSDGSHRSHLSQRSHRPQRSTDSQRSHREGYAQISTSHSSGRTHRSSGSRRDEDSSTNTSPSTPHRYAPPAILLANVTSRSRTPEPERPERPDRPEGWHRPLRSLLGSSYSRSDPGDHRRQTNLPPYTPGEHGTCPTSISEGPEGQISFGGSGNGFPTATEEKADQLRRMMAAANPSPSSPDVGRGGPSISRNFSTQPLSCAMPDDGTRRGTLAHRSEVDRTSSIPPSDVMSVYGQPPSERRDSMMTAFTVGDALGVPSVPMPSTRPQPRVITDLSRDRPRELDGPSTLSSGATNSAQPLLGRQDKRDVDVPATLYDVNLDHDLGLDLEFTRKPSGGPSAWKGGRNRSQTAMSSRSATSIGTTTSGARPDSDVIPFEEVYEAREQR